MSVFNPTTPNGTLWDATLVEEFVTAINDLGYDSWASYTPTWTGMTIGNAVVTAKWRKHGKTVVGSVKMVAGTTTSFSSGVTFSLPVSAVTVESTPCGTVVFFDVSAAFDTVGQVRINSGLAAANIVPILASGTYLQAVQCSSTIPFTWATGDIIWANFCYEAA